MTDQPVTSSGYLERGDDIIPVDTVYASGYSLFVLFKENPEIEDGTEFDGLVLGVKDRQHQFGACYFHSEPNIHGFGGRLIFTTEVYDFHSLFFKGKVFNAQNYFDNIAVVFEQKNKIVPSFKEYTSNVAYDLRVYREFFDDLEAKLRKEPEPVRSAAEVAILSTSGRRYMGFFDEMLQVLENEIKDFTQEEHARHGYYFRKQVWDIILSSEGLTLTNIKPRGYLGDPEMTAHIYENGYRGNSIFGKLMHKHPVECRAAQAVRNRRRLLTRMLLEAEKTFPGLPRAGFKFMSVACGGAYEVRDLFEQTEDAFERFSCSLLDQDGYALSEAVEAISEIEKRTGKKLNRRAENLSSLLGVRPLNTSVRTMLKGRLWETWGRFHFIYSVGLFDYLTPPVARVVARKLYELLLPGGQLVIGNFHVNNPSKWYMEYWMDWPLYYRTEEDLLDLVTDPDAVSSVFFEESGTQMFLHVKKP